MIEDLATLALVELAGALAAAGESLLGAAALVLLVLALARGEL